MPGPRRSVKRRRVSEVKRGALTRKRYNPWRDLVLGGFPQKKTVRLRYAQEIAINTGAASITTHIFRANAMFDPDYTGTGHQPSNFDRWMAIYDHYTVLQSKITARYTPTVTTNIVPALLGITLTSDPGELSGLTTEDILEKPHTATSMLAVGNQGNASGFGTVVKTFDAVKFFGKSKSSLVGDGTYRGNSSSNPTEIAYFQVFTAPIGGNNPDNMNIIVTMDFVCVLTEPVTTDES